MESLGNTTNLPQEHRESTQECLKSLEPHQSTANQAWPPQVCFLWFFADDRMSHDIAMQRPNAFPLLPTPSLA